MAARFDEVRTLTKRADDEQRTLTRDEQRQVVALRDECKALKARFDELKAQEHRRRELDTTAQEVDAVQEHTKRGGMPASFDETDLKELHKSVTQRRPLQIQSKAEVSTGDAPQSLVPSYRLADSFPVLQDVTRVLDFLPSEPTAAPKIFGFRQVDGADGARGVLEGAAKPESHPTWEDFDVDVIKLGHYVRVNDELLADFAGFRDVVGRTMLMGLLAEENDQLIAGSGNPATPELMGMLQVSDAQTRSRNGDSKLDALFKAVNDIRTAVFAEPDHVILNPNDFADIRLAKSETSGEYLTGSVLSPDPQSLWGFRVAITSHMPAGTAVVANLNMAARAYVRQTPTLEVAPLGAGDGDAFIHNQTLIRAEKRLAVVYPRPAALCIVNLSGGSSS
jgi:HK97 family phage major capsid protein